MIPFVAVKPTAAWIIISGGKETKNIDPKFIEMLKKEILDNFRSDESFEYMKDDS